MDWYDIRDYGAVIDGTTDDTTAVQDAIDACMTAGGGTVYFPPGITQISGALQNTSTHNSQLVIPTNAFGGSSKAIRFLGMGPNRIYGGTPPGGGESIIRSDWNGSISGHPAIISAGTWRTLRESFVFLSFEDLTIIAHDDPKLSAINMTAGSATRMNRVQIRTTSADPSSVPTHTNAVAYEGPWGYGSIADEDLSNVAITGFYIGMRPAEQTAGGTLAFAYCAKAMEFVGGTGSGIYAFWPNYFTKVTVVACPRGLVFVDDVRWVNIGLYGVELDAAPFGSVYDIDDASNYARGSISYNAVDAVTGPAMRALLVNGGTGLSLHSAQEKYWKLNNVVDIPTGTNPSTNPTNGRRLYTDSSTGHLSARTSAGTTIDYEAGSTSTTHYEILMASGSADPLLTSDGLDYLYVEVPN